MSQYNKTVLTALGMDLAKRANAGQATFKVTKVATSADDLGDISVEQLERMTEIPNIMQYGTITDAEPLESDNAVIGVSLRFTNKGLNNGYKIRLIGLYVREAGQQQDILYAVTTAKESEYMPDFKDQVLYRFNLQMYVVVGRTQAVSVLVDDTTVVSVNNFNKYIESNDKRVDQNVEDIKQLRQDFEANKETVKEDIKKAGQVKSVTMNSTKREPDTSGNINLGDALLPDLTGVTVGANDVDIEYNSSKNKYLADITSAVNAVIDAHTLTTEQKNSVLDDSSLVKTINGQTPTDGAVSIDTVDTVSVVDGTGVSYSDLYLTTVTDLKETTSSVKTSGTTLVAKAGFDDAILKIVKAISSTYDKAIYASDSVTDIKANYATKQWVTDNFMPKPYITNNSSTAETYSKAHPDQLVILTK